MTVAAAVRMAVGGGSDKNARALNLVAREQVYFRNYSDVVLTQYFALSQGKGGQYGVGMRHVQCAVILDVGLEGLHQNIAGEKTAHQGGHKCHNDYKGFGMGGVCHKDQLVGQP